eukprot:m.382166 g.382166  ORF g.382166 m.382166 type:complete len:105 (-) comp28255_c0_seq3:3615-3929(-)
MHATAKYIASTWACLRGAMTPNPLFSRSPTTTMSRCSPQPTLRGQAGFAAPPTQLGWSQARGDTTDAQHQHSTTHRMPHTVPMKVIVVSKVVSTGFCFTVRQAH